MTSAPSKYVCTDLLRLEFCASNPPPAEKDGGPPSVKQMDQWWNDWIKYQRRFQRHEAHVGQPA